MKPHNLKSQIEKNIAALKQDMLKHPETYEWLKNCARTEKDSANSEEKVSFSQVVNKNREIKKRYSSERADKQTEKQRLQQYEKEQLAQAQSHEAPIDAIHQVRDKAAKEIELRSAARENIGIKDAQANTGTDKLAEREQAMEGMTPQQRLAYRMSQLRGTVEETPAKPVVRREVDPNVMNKAIEGKMRA